MGIKVAGVCLHGLAVAVQGAVEPPEIPHHVAQVDVGLRIFGIELDGTATIRLCFA